MTEIEKLVLAVETTGASQTNRELDQVDRNVRKVEKSGFQLKAGLLALGAGFAAVAVGAYAITKAITGATREYQDFNAQLLVATKSQKGATEVYQALVDFAQTTPYSVGQATTAFIRLVNLGLTPSERALRSYGNTASSMNKELTDFIEAVADAATGEYERLKDFGIKASKEGDKVTFTFQGIRTTVANTSQDIEGYLQKLGENRFAGAMGERMKTLTGAISNLEDAWSQLLIAIARSGPDALITKAFSYATDAVTELKDQISSGEFEAKLKALSVEFGDIGQAAGDAADYATKAFALMGDMTEADLKDTFRHFPTYFGAAATKIVADAKHLAADLQATNELIQEQFKVLIDTNVAYWIERYKYAKETASGYLLQGLNYAMGGTVERDPTEDKKAADEYAARLKDIHDAGQKKLDALNVTAATAYNSADSDYADTLKGIGDVIDGRIQLFDQKVEEANQLRSKYDAERKLRESDSTDRLAKYKTGSDQVGPSPEELKAAQALRQKLLSANLNYLEDGMLKEGQVIANSYERRKDEILANTKSTEDEKKDLILKALSESIMSEEDALKQGYADRRAFILSDTQLTEEAKTVLLTKLAQAREAQIMALEAKNMKIRLDQASEFFGNIASIGSTFGEKGFKIAKAAAIAQATIKMYEAATGAYASLAGIPYVGPALGAAAAAAAIVAGAANIASIKQQSYAGAYAMGGMIPAGKYGVVGEQGPEIVRGPAVVTSAAASKGSNTSGITNVTVENHGQPVSATTQRNGDDLLVVLKPILEEHKKQTKRELAGEVHRGGSDLSNRLEKTYGLRRQGT